MDWKVVGVDERIRRAAEDAAARAGVPLAEWIAGAVRNAPAPGPEDIERALAALESRLRHSDETIDRLIRPLDAEIARLDAKAVDIVRQRGHGPRRDSAARHAAAADDVIEHARDRRWPRALAAVGAVVLIAGAAAAWTWLWSTQGDLPPPDHGDLTGLAPSQAPPPTVPPLPEIGPGTAAPGMASAPAGISGIPLPATAAEAAALRLRAEARDVAAEYALGMALLEGRGVPANPREAGEWLAAAAIAGHPLAQHRLGRLYGTGNGFARDTAQALFWTQSAAEQGVTEAAFELGHIYAQGAGVPASHALAARWYRQAAAHNHPGALFELGVIYERGLDVRPDPTRALTYYRRAQAAGSADAVERIAALEDPADTAPAPAAEPSPIALGHAEILEVQRLLAVLAFDPGTTDGTIGPQTVEAIRQFQEIAGLPPDGRPTRALLHQLRDLARAAGPQR